MRFLSKVKKTSDAYWPLADATGLKVRERSEVDEELDGFLPHA